jgi:hypothetical protein
MHENANKMLIISVLSLYCIGLIGSIFASNYIKKTSAVDGLNWMDYISMIILSPIYICVEGAKYIYAQYPKLINIINQFIYVIQAKLYVMWMNFMFVMTIFSLILKRVLLVLVNYLWDITTKCIDFITQTINSIVLKFINLVVPICELIQIMSMKLIQICNNVISILHNLISQVFHILQTRVIIYMQVAAKKIVLLCKTTIDMLVKLFSRVQEGIKYIYNTHVHPVLLIILYKVDNIIENVLSRLSDMLTFVYTILYENVPIIWNYVWDKIIYPTYYYLMYWPFTKLCEISGTLFHYLVFIPFDYCCDLILKLYLGLSKMYWMIDRLARKILCEVLRYSLVVLEKAHQIVESLIQSIYYLTPLIIERLLYLYNVFQMKLIWLWNNIYRLVLYPLYYYLVYVPFYVILYHKVLYFLYTNYIVIVYNTIGNFLESIWTELCNLGGKIINNLYDVWNRIFNSGRLLRLYNETIQILTTHYAQLYAKWCNLLNTINILYNDTYIKIHVLFNNIYETFGKSKVN